MLPRYSMHTEHRTHFHRRRAMSNNDLPSFVSWIKVSNVYISCILNLKVNYIPCCDAIIIDLRLLLLSAISIFLFTTLTSSIVLYVQYDKKYRYVTILYMQIFVGPCLKKNCLICADEKVPMSRKCCNLRSEEKRCLLLCGLHTLKLILRC